MQRQNEKRKERAAAALLAALARLQERVKGLVALQTLRYLARSSLKVGRVVLVHFEELPHFNKNSTDFGRLVALQVI